MQIDYSKQKPLNQMFNSCHLKTSSFWLNLEGEDNVEGRVIQWVGDVLESKLSHNFAQ